MAVTALLFGSVHAFALPAPQSGPATGHAEVIAHQVASLPDGEWQWSVAEITVSGDEPLDLDGEDAARFVVGNGDPVLLGPNEDEPVVRIAEGEGYALLPETDAVATLPEGDESELYEVRLEAGTGDDSFPAPDDAPGHFDVDLLRDVLEADESAEFVGGIVPSLVYVTDGDAEVASIGQTENGSAGDLFVVDGNFVITAVDDDAIVLVGVVSAFVEVEAEAPESARPSLAATPSLAASPSVSPSPSASPSPSPSANASPSESPSTSPSPSASPSASMSPSASPSPSGPPMDSDQDGLTDEEEQQIGSNPLSADTDGDGLPDFNEVFQHGTDPTNIDTDGDGINDHDETVLGTNPLNADTDGDGLTEVEELAFGTDPTNPDTDGDGINDWTEVINGSDPLTPNV